MHSKAEQEAKEAELARLKAELAKKEAEAKRRFLEKRKLKAANGSVADSESPRSLSSPVIPKAELSSVGPADDVQAVDVDMLNSHDGSEDGEIEDDDASALESRDLQSGVSGSLQSQQTPRPVTDGSSSNSRRKRRAPR